MKKGWLKVIFIVGIVAFLLTVIPGTLNAQYRPPPGSPETVTAIPEDNRPWAGTAWLVGAVVIGLKNAKKTHLD